MWLGIDKSNKVSIEHLPIARLVGQWQFCSYNQFVHALRGFCSFTPTLYAFAALFACLARGNTNNPVEQAQHILKIEVGAIFIAKVKSHYQ